MSPGLVLVPHDPGWPALFEAEALAVARALGSAAVTIDHVGSTAVPGLDAKPVLDVLVGLRVPELAPEQVGAMRELGYRRLRARRNGRLYFRRPGPPAVHVHVAEWGSARWTAMLRFRDRLRADPETAERYAHVKRDLAATAVRNSGLYSEEKRRFVAATLSRRR